MTRATELSKAFLASGLGPVTLFVGGSVTPGDRAPDGVRLVQLPALERGSIDSLELRSLDPGVTLEQARAVRQTILLEAYRASPPAVLVTEHYPFQPERLAGALDPLLAMLRHVRPRPLVLASVRSLSYGPTRTSAAQVRQMLAEHYDHVLHHTDPRVLPDARLGAEMLDALQGIPRTTTGFVRAHRGAPAGHLPAPFGLLLTVGGGRGSGAQLAEWIEAVRIAPRTGLLPAVAICGPLMEAADRARLHRLAGDDLRVFDQVTGLDEMLAACTGVVCLGGYNTMSEAISLGRPVLAFPRGYTQEQVMQVRAFADQGLVRSGEGLIGAGALAAAFAELPDFRPAWIPDYAGAERSAAIVAELLAQRRA